MSGPFQYIINVVVIIVIIVISLIALYYLVRYLLVRYRTRKTKVPLRAKIYRKSPVLPAQPEPLIAQAASLNTLSRSITPTPTSVPR